MLQSKAKKAMQRCLLSVVELEVGQTLVGSDWHGGWRRTCTMQKRCDVLHCFHSNDAKTLSCLYIAGYVLSAFIFQRND